MEIQTVNGYKGSAPPSLSALYFERIKYNPNYEINNAFLRKPVTVELSVF